MSNNEVRCLHRKNPIALIRTSLCIGIARFEGDWIFHYAYNIICASSCIVHTLFGCGNW